MTARFVALEGGEGCGKSTQAVRLASALDAVLTREPGGTAVGSRVRELLLDPSTGSLAERAEALLMAADRAQHIAEVVAPALAAGRHVVADRSAYSSLAYQGYGRGLDIEELRRLSSWAAEDCWPDVVVLLDVDLETSRARTRARAADRLESEDDDFHGRVLAGFRALAAADPDRWVVVDATGAVDEIADQVLQAVRSRL